MPDGAASGDRPTAVGRTEIDLPGDPVGALVFLSSPASDVVNGQMPCVDGSMTCVP